MSYCVSGLVFALLIPALAHAAMLENPGNGSFYSGIGVISGWKCSANGQLTVRFNGGSAIPLAYRNERGDTRGTCGDTNNGFVAIWNWAELGDGTHTAVVYDNGREFARSTFTVATLGEAFVTGASGECTIQNFPSYGETATFEWNQNTQHLELTEGDGGGPGPHVGESEYHAYAYGRCESGGAYGVALNHSTDVAAYVAARDECRNQCPERTDTCKVYQEWDTLSCLGHTWATYSDGRLSGSWSSRRADRATARSEALRVCRERSPSGASCRIDDVYCPDDYRTGAVRGGHLAGSDDGPPTPSSRWRSL